MNNEINKLTELFNGIKEKGWTKSNFNGDGQCGRLFEELIGNNENSFQVPDYNGIEIKTKQSIIEKYITLFSYSPEGNHILECERIKDTYGYPDKKCPSYKVLNLSIYNNMATKVGDQYIFFPTIDISNKKIVLNIYDINLNLLENNIHWDFDEIEKIMIRKMSYLAFVSAEKKYENGNYYFKYNNIEFYKYKGFDYFMRAFKICKIRITFKLNIYKYGNKLGKIHDHGTSFDIRADKLNLIYDTIEQ